MEKMKYRYICPTQEGYVKFKVTRKQHNALQQTVKASVFTKIEAFYSEDRVILHYSTKLSGKLLATLIAPYYVLLHGISVLSEYKDVWKSKRNGGYTDSAFSKYSYSNKPNKVFQYFESIYKSQYK